MLYLELDCLNFVFYLDCISGQGGAGTNINIKGEDRLQTMRCRGVRKEKLASDRVGNLQNMGLRISDVSNLL